MEIVKFDGYFGDVTEAENEIEFFKLAWLIRSGLIDTATLVGDVRTHAQKIEWTTRLATKRPKASLHLAQGLHVVFGYFENTSFILLFEKPP